MAEVSARACFVCLCERVRACVPLQVMVCVLCVHMRGKALIACKRANTHTHTHTHTCTRQINPELAEAVFERTGLLKWLLARVRRRASDSNRLYASELLAILMQARPPLTGASSAAPGGRGPGLSQRARRGARGGVVTAGVVQGCARCENSATLGRTDCAPQVRDARATYLLVTCYL